MIITFIFKKYVIKLCMFYFTLAYKIFTGFIDQGSKFLTLLEDSNTILEQVHSTANRNVRYFLEQDIDTRLFYADFLNKVSHMKELIKSIQIATNEVLSGTSTNGKLFDIISSYLLEFRKEAEFIQKAARVETNKKLMSDIIKLIDEMNNIAGNASPVFQKYVTHYVNMDKASNIIIGDIVAMTAILSDIMRSEAETTIHEQNSALVISIVFVILAILFGVEESSSAVTEIAKTVDHLQNRAFNLKNTINRFKVD